MYLQAGFDVQACIPHSFPLQLVDIQIEFASFLCTAKHQVITSVL